MLRLAVPLLAAFAWALSACGGDDAEADLAARTSSHSTPTSAQLEELTKLTVAGFTAGETSPSLVGSTVVYTSDRQTAGGANILVRVSLVPCDAFICGSLDPNEYASADAQRNMKSVLPADHVNNPNLRWEFGAFKLSANATGLAYYGLSYLESKSVDGSVSRSSANTFRAWYHNGATLIALDIFGRSGTSVLSQADLEKRMTRAEAEQAARDVFAVFEPKLPS